jgi:EAL domain-containing protein (putative c-di-GMP-specific phosphodiesterase class I)
VAEGVETREEAAILFAEGCDEFQGFFYARPMEAHEFQAWVTNRKSENGIAAAHSMQDGNVFRLKPG